VITTKEKYQWSFLTHIFIYIVMVNQDMVATVKLSK